MCRSFVQGSIEALYRLTMKFNLVSSTAIGMKIATSAYAFDVEEPMGRKKTCEKILKTDVVMRKRSVLRLSSENMAYSLFLLMHLFS